MNDLQNETYVTSDGVYIFSFLNRNRLIYANRFDWPKDSDSFLLTYMLLSSGKIPGYGSSLDSDLWRLCYDDVSEREPDATTFSSKPLDDNPGLFGFNFSTSDKTKRNVGLAVVSYVLEC